MIPDGSTAANALVTGEVDWIEIPLPDLLPMLKRTPGVTVGVLDTDGQILPASQPLGRANQQSRRASRHAAALDQQEVMAASMAPIRRTCSPGSASCALANRKWTTPAWNWWHEAYARSGQGDVDRAGDNGERIVLLHATDHWFFNPTAAVIAHSLSAAGINIDDQAMNWATVNRAETAMNSSTRAVGRCFRLSSPHLITAIRCSPTHPRQSQGGTVRLAFRSKDRAVYAEWLGVADPAEQTRLERAYQLQAFETLPYIPLGGYRQSAAWRTT